MPDPTMVISRSPLAERDRREFEDALAADLVESGIKVLTVPHIYYLHPGHRALRRLTELGGDAALGAWLHPRAARWTLSALGVDTQSRKVVCYDLGAFASAKECTEQMCRGFAAPAGPRPRAEEIADAVEARWYPVLDYSLCAGCGQCLDFCLFGVYSRESDRVVASSPDNCKPGCPACARVCPSGAIMFPHYADDPAIAGAPGVHVGAEPIDVNRFFQEPQAEAKPGERCPVCGRAQDGERPPEVAAPPGESVCPACGAVCDRPDPRRRSRRDDLRELMNALDEFDE